MLTFTDPLNGFYIMDTQNGSSIGQDESVLLFRGLPLVCHNIPLVKPTVCINVPFIKTSKQKAGFTLVELIITLTIAGILVALAGPAMQSFILDQRLTTQANDFIADLNLSRSEAIRQSSNVVICKQGGSVSSPSCSTTAAWGAGWVVFVDANSNGALASNESVLRIRQSLDGGNTLNATSGTNSLVFANTGLTTLSSATEVAMRLCDSRGASKAVTVWVNFTGPARIDRTTRWRPARHEFPSTPSLPWKASA